MLIRATQKSVRVSPRKMRLVADSLRGLPLSDIKHQLHSLNKSASLPLRKTLSQAIANAVNNHQLSEKNLKLKEIQIGEGSTFKRWQPVSRGRAHPILKRTSHIRITLETKAPEPQLSPKSPKPTKKEIISTKKVKTTKSIKTNSSKALKSSSKGKGSK